MFDIFVGYRVSRKEQFFLIDDSFGELTTFDPLRNLGCLTWIALHVGVPVTGLYVPKCKTVKVKTNYLDLAILAMADTSRLERLNSALRHTVVLSVDDVEILFRCNRGFNHFAGFLKAPTVSTRSISHNGEFTFFCGFEHCGAATYFSCATQLTTNKDQIDRFRNTFQYPVYCRITLISHIREKCCLIVRRGRVNRTVKENNLNACIFCRL